MHENENETYDVQLLTQLKRKDWITNTSADKWQWILQQNRTEVQERWRLHNTFIPQTSSEMMHLTYLKINMLRMHEGGGMTFTEHKQKQKSFNLSLTHGVIFDDVEFNHFFQF